MNAPTSYRDSGLSRPQVRHQRRSDGTVLIEAVEVPPPGAYPLGISGFVARWARERGAQPAFRERCDDAAGGWRTLDWDGFEQQMLAVAAGLLALGLGQRRPLMILAGNSIAHAVIVAAAEHVGIATVPVSLAHAAATADPAALRAMCELVEPGAVFVDSGLRTAAALQAIALPAERVIALHDAGPGQLPWSALLASAPTPRRQAAIDAARARIDAQTDIARIFFTSGSTGVPKAVPISYDGVAAQIANALYFHQAWADAPMVLLDWLPWSHVFGGLGTLCRVFALGGTYCVDDGRPQPGSFARTVRNLREIAPTIYASVPAAFALLVPELERDAAFAKAFFSRLRYAGYGGASLPRDLWQRFQAAAQHAIGQSIVFVSAFGATETGGGALQYSEAGDDIGNIGIPNPGVAVKLVPLDGDDGRHEIRIRGRQVFRGYLGNAQASADAFDDEGYFQLGDAVRLVDPAAPSQGLRYAGRCAEDFKLRSGTWVRTGAVRVALLDVCAPLLRDAVICGHDRDDIAALAWPDVEACRALSPQLQGLPLEQLVRHPQLIAALGERLSRQAPAASRRVERVVLMAEPPSRDGHEITDKGYVNQAVTRQRRAGLIDRLYAAQADAAVARAG